MQELLLAEYSLFLLNRQILLLTPEVLLPERQTHRLYSEVNQKELQEPKEKDTQHRIQPVLLQVP